jgi:hypothetical protein
MIQINLDGPCWAMWNGNAASTFESAEVHSAESPAAVAPHVQRSIQLGYPGQRDG